MDTEQLQEQLDLRVKHLFENGVSVDKIEEDKIYKILSDDIEWAIYQKNEC